VWVCKSVDACRHIDACMHTCVLVVRAYVCRRVYQKRLIRAYRETGVGGHVDAALELGGAVARNGPLGVAAVKRALHAVVHAPHCGPP
jgi:hypothetical protein